MVQLSGLEDPQQGFAPPSLGRSFPRSLRELQCKGGCPCLVLQLPEPDPGSLTCLSGLASGLPCHYRLAGGSQGSWLMLVPIATSAQLFLPGCSRKVPRGSETTTLPALLPPSAPSSPSKADPLLLLPDAQGSDLAHQKVNNFWLGNSSPPLTVLIRAPLTVLGA